jgi:hypothetical protein
MANHVRQNAANDVVNEPYLSFPERPRDRFLVSIIVILVGAVGGALFGGVSGGILARSHRIALLGLVSGELSGAIIGALCGALFVIVGLLLYRFIRGPLSGAIVLGVFATLVMAAVGGLFGAVVGLLSGVVLGAFIGSIRAHGPRRGISVRPPGGWTVVRTPAQTPPPRDVTLR